MNLTWFAADLGKVTPGFHRRGMDEFPRPGEAAGAGTGCAKVLTGRLTAGSVEPAGGSKKEKIQDYYNYESPEL